MFQMFNKLNTLETGLSASHLYTIPLGEIRETVVLILKLHFQPNFVQPRNTVSNDCTIYYTT